MTVSYLNPCPLHFSLYTAPLAKQGAVGNTPLHFACLLEKPEHAIVLLEFGADANVVNEHGQTALQLVPKSAVMSV